MARRFRYGYNGQWNNYSTVGIITPIGYIETIPGETWSGSVNVNFWSDTTKQPWTNKMFADVFAFYVPFRLLWSRFPDFVRGEVNIDESGVADTPPEQAFGNVAWNYIQQSGPRPNVWQMRAYNLIVDKFFDYQNFLGSNVNVDDAMGDANNGPYDDTEIKYAAYRSSVFDTSSKSADEIHDAETVDTSGATLSVDDIRNALQRDNFNKLRDMYGSRYVDYLAALGVKGQWTMMDEPELIGQVHHTLPLEITTATNEQDTPEQSQFVGTPRGAWKGDVKLSMKKAFTPEHGMLVFIAVNRLQAAFRDGRPQVGFNKVREHYWSPEYTTGINRNYIDGQFGATSPDRWMPNFEHLRKGENMMADRTTDGGGYYFQRGQLSSQSSELINSANSLNWSNVDDIFDGTFPNIPKSGDDITSHFTHTADYRLIKYSPLTPNGYRQPLR